MGQADFDLSQSEVSTLSGISMFFSSLSVCGSLFIVFCYIRFKDLRTLPFKLVFWLSVNDFLNQVGDFMQPTSAEVLAARTADDDHIGTLCLVQAVTESFFELSSVLWTTSISFVLYMGVFKRMKEKEVESKFYIWIVSFCYGLPLILTIIPWAAGMYGGAGAWCWIKPGHVEWRFLQFYVPLWLAIAYNAFVYVKVIQLIKNTAKARAGRVGGPSGTADKLLAFINRLRWYPIILVIVWGFASINRVYESIAQENLFWLTCLQKSFSSLQGLLNAIAYGMNDGIRQALLRDFPALRRLCPCCCGSKDEESGWAANPVAGQSPAPARSGALNPDASGDGEL